MTTAVELGRFAAALAYDDLPSSVRRRALDIAVDTLAAIRVGASEPFCSQYLSRCLEHAPPGNSTVIGSRTPTSPDTAAPLNAVSATVMQMDEGHRPSRGHPGIHVVPAAIAACEDVAATGADLVCGIVSGYEVAARIGMLLGRLRPGVHPHGSWGSIGAAVALARVWHADANTLSDVIEAMSTVPIAPWSATTNAGATLHHMYVPLGIQAAFSVTRAVLAGATVAGGALEQHLVPVLSTNGQLVARPATSGFETERGYFKLFPTCAHTHAVLDMVANIKREQALRASDVLKVDVFGFAELASMSNPCPANNLAARFSLEYCVAATLVDPETLDHPLIGHPLQPPAIQNLMKRIVLHHDPALDAGYPDRGRPARVVIHLLDGSILKAEKDLPYGDYGDPPSEQVLALKGTRAFGHRYARIAGLISSDPGAWAVSDLARLALADLV